MTLRRKSQSLRPGCPHGAEATLDQQVLTIERLIAGNSTEKADRETTYALLKEAVAGRKDALLEMPLHSCALLSYSAHDIDKLAALDYSDADSAEVLSRLASMYLQVAQYRMSGELFEKLAHRRPLTSLESFLAYKAAFMRRDDRLLEDFVTDSIRPLTDRSPDIAYELLARHQMRDDSAAYCKEASEYADVADAEKLHNWSQRFRTLQIAGGEFDEKGLKPAQGYLTDIVAVYGMRCSGGSAIQDFLSDSSEVKSSAGEYLLMSGIYGLRYLHKHSYSGFVFHEMLRHHFFGLAVPVNRSFSRVLRQAREDRRVGLLPDHERAIDRAFESSRNRFEVVQNLLGEVWKTYVSYYRKKILLKKLFSSGNFENLHQLPPFIGIMVWRDPRDQYADQCQRGFVRRGDVATFVNEFRAKVKRLKEGLGAASDKHRLNFVNVGFEEFVQSQDCRNNVLGRIGISAESVRSQNFDPEKSIGNIGVWKDSVSADEVTQIERSLPEYMDSSSVSLETILTE